MGATNNIGDEKTPPATDDLEKQKLETDPVLTPAPGGDELKGSVKRRKRTAKGTGTAGKGNAKASQTTGVVALALLLFFGLFALITWLALRPVHQPNYWLNNVQIKSLAVNATASTVDADFLYNVTAYNNNRKMDFK